METKRERTIKDARAFALGAAWGYPLARAAEIFIRSKYQAIRWDLIGISSLVAVLFIMIGRENYNIKDLRDADHTEATKDN